MKINENLAFGNTDRCINLTGVHRPATQQFPVGTESLKFCSNSTILSLATSKPKLEHWSGYQQAFESQWKKNGNVPRALLLFVDALAPSALNVYILLLWLVPLVI